MRGALQRLPGGPAQALFASRINGLSSSDEAAAYLAHSLLGHRLNECAGIVAALDADAIEDVFPPPDDLKFHSSMTLFADVAPDVAVFQACIDKYFDGAPDRNTLARL